MSMIACQNCKTRYWRWKTCLVETTRVAGVTGEKGETCEDCERQVLEILKNKLQIEDVTIERVDRVKLYQNKKIAKASPHLEQ